MAESLAVTLGLRRGGVQGNSAASGHSPASLSEAFPALRFPLQAPSFGWALPDLAQVAALAWRMACTLSWLSISSSILHGTDPPS